VALIVTHFGKDLSNEMLVQTTYESSSWTLDDLGNLIIGDSLGNPEAAYHKEHWHSVEKSVDEDSEDTED
jgi:hypothetical protein